MILFNMTMSVCSFVEWSCCCLLDVFCIVECEFVGFCADQNRTEWVWSATCETVRRVFVALEHRCLLWFVLHRLCSTYLLFWEHVSLCRVKTKRRDSFYQKSQYGTQSYDVFRGSTTRRTNLRLPQDERVDVTLVHMSCFCLEGRCENHPYASHEQSSVAPPCGRDSQESVTSAAAGLTTS